MTYYIKGGSRYNGDNPKVWTALFLGGYSESLYTTAWENLADKGVETAKDPYWRLGSSSGGAQTAEFGLYNDYRIEIDQANGVRAWNGSGWVDLLAGAGSPDLNDLGDVIITAPADNEVLAYDNGSSKWINQTPAEAGLALGGHNHNLNDLAEKDHISLANVTAAQHHAKWTTGDTEGVITAEIVGGQSIDNAIDALILTHKNIATAHHSNVNDHAEAHTIVSHSDTTATGAELDTLTDGSDASTLHLHTLDTIANPAGDKEFNFANKHLHFKWVAPASGAHEGAFEIEASGAFSGDLVHIHQHTGNVGTTNMVFIECEDDDSTPLKVVHGTKSFSFGKNGMVLSQTATISFDAVQADTENSGVCIDIDTTGCNLFDLVYIDGADSVAPADATDDTKMPAIGIVVAAGKVLISGVVTDDDLIKCTTPNAIVYASLTLREVTETAPSANGEMIQVVGICVGDHSLYVNVSLDMVEFVE